MTEKPPNADYNALAKRYLDLWQEQVAKMAQDPGQLGSAAATWSQMAATMMQNAAPKPHPAPTPPATTPKDAHDAKSNAKP